MLLKAVIKNDIATSKTDKKAQPHTRKVNLSTSIVEGTSKMQLSKPSICDQLSEILTYF
jgi:hypothetical protein